MMDIRSVYSCLLGHPWIHGAGAVTSTLHQKLKYPVKGKIIIEYGEEEYTVSHLNSFKYVDMDNKFIETPFQTFEVIPRTTTVTEDISSIPKVTRIPPKMASLKDTRVVVEEGGCTTWGQLPDIPYMSNRFGLGFTSKAQRAINRARVGTPPFCINNNEVKEVEEANSDYDLNSWIFPTTGNELNNWKTEDVIPISFSQECKMVGELTWVFFILSQLSRITRVATDFSFIQLKEKVKRTGKTF